MALFDPNCKERRFEERNLSRTRGFPAWMTST
jgi:hypothetical protein